LSPNQPPNKSGFSVTTDETVNQFLAQKKYQKRFARGKYLHGIIMPLHAAN